MNKKIISFVTAFFMIFTLFDFPVHDRGRYAKKLLW